MPWPKVLASDGNDLIPRCSQQLAVIKRSNRRDGVARPRLSETGYLHSHLLLFVYPSALSSLMAHLVLLAGLVDPLPMLVQYALL